MTRIFSALLFAGLALAGPAAAYPNGAPWGSANPKVEPNCSSCHFDGEAVEDSNAISVFYGEDSIAGERDAFYVQFRNPHNKKAGFQINATAGKFASVYEDIETNGTQARSVAPRDNSSWPRIIGVPHSLDAASGVIIWRLDWSPPEKLDGDLYFWIAVNESDDDASPFGDQIHYKEIHKIMPGDFWLLPPLR